MRYCSAISVTLAFLFAVGCQNSSGPQGEDSKSPDSAGTVVRTKGEIAVADKTQPVNQERQQELLITRVTDQLASLMMLEPILETKLQGVAIEQLAATQALTFDERLAWGICAVCFDNPDQENVAASLKLLKRSSEITTFDDVKAFVERQARHLELKTAEQHHSTVDFSIRWHNSMTSETAAGVVKVLSMMEASNTQSINDSKSKIQELLRAVFASNSNLLTAFSDAEEVAATYKSEEQKKSRELLRELLAKAKLGEMRQEEKPTPPNDKESVRTAEDQVVEFLATRTMLENVFRDPMDTLGRAKLNGNFLDWLALGVDEPLDQRLAYALVSDSGPLLRDPTYFDGVDHRAYVRSRIELGMFHCGIATSLLRDNTDYGKNYLTASEGSLAYEGMRKSIHVVVELQDKSFDSTLAGYTSRELDYMKKDVAPKMTEVYTALCQAIRKALHMNPELAASLQEKIKIAADVRASHERVSKLIRTASGG